jgi:hypothetical protein|nr:MAG TPA: Protein of unknown function (DUF2681) [Caudoviricetes sp.]DAY16805.1 MAG TPA: Protein of unknown function (DUF2681) [Caudoviricetes sp.]
MGSRLIFFFRKINPSYIEDPTKGKTMLYIALCLVTILSIFFAVAHEEQKYAAFNLKARVRTLEVENAKLRAELMTDEEWDTMVEQALAVSR